MLKQDTTGKVLLALFRELTSILAGVMLLALDVLPILIWAAIVGGMSVGTTNVLSPALVGGTFLIAVVLSFVTAPLIHRLSHAVAARLGDTRAAERNRRS